MVRVSVLLMVVWGEGRRNGGAMLLGWGLGTCLVLYWGIGLPLTRCMTLGTSATVVAAAASRERWLAYWVCLVLLVGPQLFWIPWWFPFRHESMLVSIAMLSCEEALGAHVVLHRILLPRVQPVIHALRTGRARFVVTSPPTGLAVVTDEATSPSSSPNSVMMTTMPE